MAGQEFGSGVITGFSGRSLVTSLFAYAMMELDRHGYKIVMHVHDEVVLEVPESVGYVKEACVIMSRTPGWVDGLPLEADGYECEFYRKEW